MHHIFKHFGYDCRQKNTTAENKQQHFAGMFSGNSDLMTGALIHRLTGGFESYSLCVLKFASGIFAVTSVVASVQHLTLLSIDRYIAIKYPFKYLEMVTIRRLTVTVAFAWLVAAFLAVLTALYTVDHPFTFYFRNFCTVSQYFHSGLLPNCCLS